MANKTTIREFQHDKENFFEIVRDWALSANFEIKEKRDNYRLYHFNNLVGVGVHGWLIAEHNGQVARLEAWIGPRENGNFMKGEKMSLHENNFVGIVARKHYKTIFNRLLDVLEEPRI